MDNLQTVNEKIEFMSSGTPFSGKVCRPENLTQCKGIVIFTHGLGYCVKQYKINGEYFARSGYLLLTYNLRGHAGTPGKWSVDASVQDLVAAIDHLTQNYKFPSNERICVMGHSTGAFSFFCFLSLILTARYKAFGLLFFLLALSVCYSRMYLAAHFFDDVYAGSILGTTLTMLMFSIMNQYKSKFFKKNLTA